MYMFSFDREKCIRRTILILAILLFISIVLLFALMAYQHYLAASGATDSTVKNIIDALANSGREGGLK